MRLWYRVAALTVFVGAALAAVLIGTSMLALYPAYLAALIGSSVVLISPPAPANPAWFDRLLHRMSRPVRHPTIARLCDSIGMGIAGALLALIAPDADTVGQKAAVILTGFVVGAVLGVFSFPK